jgi:hypothetical protein
MAARFMQQQLPQPVQLCAAIDEPLGHGRAVDQPGRTGHNAAGLALGMNLDSIEGDQFTHRYATVSTPAAFSSAAS